MKLSALGAAALAIALSAQPASAQVGDWMKGVGDTFSSLTGGLTKGFGGDWQGFYAGGGASFARSRFELAEGRYTITINDSATPAVDFQAVRPLEHQDNIEASHILGGFLAQKGNVILGLEGDIELGNEFYRPQQIGPGECTTPFIPVTGTAACVALNTFGGFQTQGHLRLIGGYEVSDHMMVFASGGAAFGQMADRFGVSAGGFVAQSPSAPLVGSATVSRSNMEQSLTGYTFGGGMTFKATDHLRVRAEYLYDFYHSVDIAIGGVGFGGALGTVTTNSFASMGDEAKFETSEVRISAMWQF